MTATTSYNIADEFRRWASLVQANDMSSGALLQALTGFDLIRWDTAPEVLEFAESLRGQHIEPSLLAGLLIVQSAIAGGR